MENKYYQPTIEEFHVGFESEINGKPYQFTSIGFTEWLISKGRLNVKCLDKEDIESLGFEYVGFKNFSLEFKMKSEKSGLLISIDDFLYINYYEKSKIVIISNHGEFECYDGISLTIKNKSELKMILKMIGA